VKTNPATIKHCCQLIIFIFFDKMLPKNNKDVARLSMLLEVQHCHHRNTTTNAAGF